jgi:glycosyltransferase involved in cell wall biosynthesis
VKLLFALAGFHRVNRGAEVALIAVASELARGGHDVTLIGGGPEIAGRPYKYLRARCVARERFEHFPKLPMLRQDTAWEELSFVPGLLAAYRPADYDLTVTCGFPYTNLGLRRPLLGGRRPKHIFVTQNGDWPAYSDNAEYRLFGCDGLVCTNPDYFDRNRHHYHSALIPNGVDLRRFRPGPAARQRFGLDPLRPVVLMVSALIRSKFVDVAIDAVSSIGEAQLVVAGDGPMRAELAARAETKLVGRYRQLRVSPEEMPDLYRSADVLLHLSKDESFGNVFVEALATGLPIVAYDLPRTRWIVGDCAFLAQAGDACDLVRQMTTALEARGATRRESVRRASQFSWDKVASRYAEFMKEVVVRPAQ